MPNIDSVSFDLSDCELIEHSDMHRMWVNKAGIYQNLRVSQQPPAWPFDLRDYSAASDYYFRQCAENKGVMLEMEVIQIGELEALRGLFKYRSPVQKSLAMMFVHIIWIPFKNWTIQINIEALERGTTGMREAAVMMIEGDKWPKPSLEDPPIEINGTEEMFEKMRSHPLRVLPSDDAKYDKTFVNHPLSMVRNRMTQILSSLTVFADTSDLSPFIKNNRSEVLCVEKYVA